LKKAPKENQNETRSMRSRALTNFLRLLALLTVAGITFYIYSIRNRVEDFAAFGYPGIFLVALMANATVFLPAPG